MAGAKKIKVRQVASPARRKHDQRETLIGLGLNRIDRIAELPDTAATRGMTKGGALYRNSDWDLVDKLKEEPTFDVTKVPAEELSEEMKKLKPEERSAYVKKKAVEREAIQKRIADATAKREAFLAEHRKQNPPAAEKAFDEAVRVMLREQAAAKGVRIP